MLQFVDIDKIVKMSSLEARSVNKNVTEKYHAAGVSQKSMK